MWNESVAANHAVRGSSGVNAAVTVRERVENTGAGICGGSTLRCVARQGSALRSDRWRGTAWP
jgi:hypothetical protein